MPTATTSRTKMEERAPRSYSGVRRSEGPEIPQVPDGTYMASIADITETDSLYGGTQLKIKWEISDLLKANGAPQDIGSFVAIPPTLVSDGALNENSNLFKLMQALGFDMASEELDVDPPAWQGMECQITVQNKVVKEGDNAGQTRPKITAYTAIPAALRSRYATNTQEAAPPPAAKRPVPPRPASAPPASAPARPAATRAAAPANDDDGNDF